MGVQKIVNATTILSALLVISSFAQISKADKVTKVPIQITLPDEVMKTLSPNQRGTLERLKRQAEEDIQIVQNIDYEPPQSVFSAAKTGQIVTLSNLFQKPDDAHELQQLSVDSQGKKKNLNSDQWDQIADEALLVVPSEKYPGQFHIWKLHTILQKGRKNIEITKQENYASGLELLTINAPAYLSGDIPGNGRFKILNKQDINVAKGMDNIYRGLRNSLSLLVGLAETRPLYTEYDIFRVLDKARAEYALNSVQKQSDEVAKSAEATSAELGFKPDFRLYDNKVVEKILPVVSNLEQQMANDFEKQEPELRAKLQGELVRQGLKGDALNQALLSGLAQIKQEIFYSKIVENRELETASPGIGRLIVNNGKSIAILMAGETLIDQEVSKKAAEVSESLRKLEPVKSRIAAWFNNEVNTQVQAFYEQIRTDRYTQIVQKLHDLGFVQESYILAKNIDFALDEESNLSNELRAQQQAAREYVYGRTIWQPKNWIISQAADGTYYARTKLESTVSSASVLWRLQNLAQGTRAEVKNGIYDLMYSNLWNGPVGVRTLVGTQRFSVGSRLNRTTGQLEPSGKSTGTIWSRIIEVRQYQKMARAKFEAAPDNSFFGKKFSRLALNIAQTTWMASEAVLTVVRVAAVVANVGASTALSATAVVWAPATQLLQLGFNAVVFDTKAPRGAKWYRSVTSRLFPLLNQIVLKSGVTGVLQIGVGLTMSACDVVGGNGLLVFGKTRELLRTGYDVAARGLMRTVGVNIPARDSFLVTRIQGPGLSKDYYFQIRPELALVAFWAKMEADTFAQYQENVSRIIANPQSQYRNFVQTFGEFPQLKIAGQQITDAQKANSKASMKALESYNKLYAALLTNPYSGKIRMSHDDLKITLQMTAALAQKYYSGILNGLSSDQVREFWKSRKLPVDDYISIARNLVMETFSPNMLMPLEDVDKSFRLIVDGKTASEYVADVLTGKPVEDPLQFEVDSLIGIRQNGDQKLPKVGPGSSEICNGLMSRIASGH